MGSGKFYSNAMKIERAKGKQNSAKYVFDNEQICKTTIKNVQSIKSRNDDAYIYKHIQTTQNKIFVYNE